MLIPLPSYHLRQVCREEIAKYDRLKKNYEDPTFEVVSGVFRALSKKKIIGSGSFQRCVLIILRLLWWSNDLHLTVVMATQVSKLTSRRFRVTSSCSRNISSSSPNNLR